MWMINTRANRISATVFHKHKYISNPTVTPGDAVISAAQDLAAALKGKMTHYLQESPLSELYRLRKIFSASADVPKHRVEPSSAAVPEQEAAVEPQPRRSHGLITHVDRDGQITASSNPPPVAPTTPPIPWPTYIQNSLEAAPRRRQQIQEATLLF